MQETKMEKILFAVLAWTAPVLLAAQPSAPSRAPGAGESAAKPGPAVAPAVSGETEIIPSGRRKTGGLRAERRHVVRKGDTLWDLSGKYYGDPFLWGRIYNANMGAVSNPDLILPRQELVIPGAGETVLPARVPTPAAVPSEAAQAAAVAAVPAQPAVQAAAAPPAVPSSTAPAAVPAPAAAPVPAQRVVENTFSGKMPHDQSEWAGGVLVVPDNWREDGVITARLKSEDHFLDDSMAETGSMMKVSMSEAGMVKPGDVLKAYLRAADVYSKDGKKLGRGLQPAGELEVISVDGRTAKARVTEAFTAILAGYLVKKK